MMGGIGVVHNPYARKNLKKPETGDLLRNVLGGCGTFYETRSIQEIEDAARDFIEKGYDILAINGGDGSVHIVVTSFKKVLKGSPFPRLVILRGGTMNTISNSLKLKGSPVKTLSKTVEIYKKKKKFDLIHQQVLKVGDLYGFMSGAGAISTFLDTYYSGRHTGIVEAVKMVTLLILSTIGQTDYVKRIFRQTRMKVVIDGKDPGQEAYMAVLGCAVRELGLGFAVAHSANEKKGNFHFTATSMKPFSLVLRLWSLWAGKDIVHPDMYHHGSASDVLIEPIGTLRWMLDGEMYETNDPLRISVDSEISIINI